MSLSPFVLEDGCPTNEDEFPPQAFLQSKQAFDLAVLLPDARLIFIEFNNQPRTLQWASSWIMERFSSSFAGEPPGLWSPCHCRGHWLRLDGRAVVQPGQGLTILALSPGTWPASHARTRGHWAKQDCGPRTTTTRSFSATSPSPKAQKSPSLPAEDRQARTHTEEHRRPSKPMPGALRMGSMKPRQPPGPPPGWEPPAKATVRSRSPLDPRPKPQVQD